MLCFSCYTVILVGIPTQDRDSRRPVPRSSPEYNHLRPCRCSGASFPSFPTHRVGRVDGHERGCLREAVSLDDLDVDVLEKVQNLHRGGRAPDERGLEVSAEPLPNLAQNQLRETRIHAGAAYQCKTRKSPGMTGDESSTKLGFNPMVIQSDRLDHAHFARKEVPAGRPNKRFALKPAPAARLLRTTGSECPRPRPRRGKKFREATSAVARVRLLASSSTCTPRKAYKTGYASLKFDIDCRGGEYTARLWGSLYLVQNVVLETQGQGDGFPGFKESPTMMRRLERTLEQELPHWTALRHLPPARRGNPPAGTRRRHATRDTEGAFEADSIPNQQHPS